MRTLFTLVFVAVLVTLYWLQWRSRRIRVTRLTSRGVLSLDDIVMSMLRTSSARETSASRFREEWNAVASILGIPPDQLRPEDRFAVELHPASPLDPLYAKLEDLEDFVRGRGIGAPETLTTVGELVVTLAQQEGSLREP